MLTVAEVERIAQLARLALSEEEKARYARQLSAILDYAAQLAELDVEGIPPTATVLAVHSVMREGDDVVAGLPRTDALRNAPDTDGVSFIVQATFDDED
ncbi:MAG: Asp-tRNA(Asn)/Glu-tRNA(Gln) amidotransferase subunit GatC [Thermoflexales bacterium]|nr:Asp-tRNA(Asn)/Glu-tRNA(Gln) amidotransferase subunit GatC [Thermoflexales bacterium]MDW8351370.1 Asp-tRNA(Asn)/Glu-tRNA(Gln) amidotransferase subunit GatC [Anaerolineae bacterium]